MTCLLPWFLTFVMFCLAYYETVQKKRYLKKMLIRQHALDDAEGKLWRIDRAMKNGRSCEDVVTDIIKITASNALSEDKSLEDYGVEDYDA